MIEYLFFMGLLAFVIAIWVALIGAIVFLWDAIRKLDP